ncbi:MAG TPA: ABC transporter permease [Candidatus Krumholzibacteria bacterium]
MKASDSGAAPPIQAFRMLLRVYPQRLRATYGADLLEAFEDAWREEAAGASPFRRMRFWLHLIRDAIRVAAGEPRYPQAAAPAPSRVLAALCADARYALRSLAKQPGFAALVVIVLALGLGANAAVFNALHAVVIQPLPYAGGERLLRIFEYDGDTPQRNYVTAPSFLGWRENMRTLDRVAALYSYRQTGADFTGGDKPERLRTLRVSSGYLRAYGATPSMGREFSRDEERGDTDTAFVSHRFWRTRLQTAPDVLGRRITLDGTPYTIVGVAPEGFSDAVAGPVDVWLNLDLERSREMTGNWYLTVIGRLAPGANVTQARHEAERVERALEDQLAGLSGHHPISFRCART